MGLYEDPGLVKRGLVKSGLVKRGLLKEKHKIVLLKHTFSKNINNLFFCSFFFFTVRPSEPYTCREQYEFITKTGGLLYSDARKTVYFDTKRQRFWSYGVVNPKR